MITKKLVVALVATLSAAALASSALAAADAKSPATGVWSGMTHQDLPPLTEDSDFHEWKQHIVVRTSAGRLTYLGVSVRYMCPDPTNPEAGDIQIEESWPSGRGPRLTKNGGFSLNIAKTKNILTGRTVRIYAPVHIAGLLGAKGASGRFDLARGNCSGKGSWKARRVF
jgi:hypothetical protein